MVQRWCYHKQDGTPIWLAFDPDFACVYCEKPVGNLSMGGPAICPSCDCGYTDGKQWDLRTFWKLADNARRRFEEMPDDPKWAEYEAAYRAHGR